MLTQQGHHQSQQGTRASGGGLRIAAFAASIAYLTYNVQDYRQHMEQMPYTGELTTVPPSALTESVESGERVFKQVRQGHRDGTRGQVGCWAIAA